MYLCKATQKRVKRKKLQVGSNVISFRHTLLLGVYYVLGACFLPGAWYHLLSACALKRIHNGSEISSKPWYQELNCGTLNGHPEVKHEKSYTGCSDFWLTQSHKPHPSQLMRLLLKFLLYDTWDPTLNTQWMWITVSLRKRESSDFMSILKTCITIYCIALHITVMPACKAWLSLHPLFSTCPLSGTYLLTTYTCKSESTIYRPVRTSTDLVDV